MTNSAPVGLDVSKWRHVSAYPVAPIEAVSGLVTDAKHRRCPYQETRRATLKNRLEFS